MQFGQWPVQQSRPRVRWYLNERENVPQAGRVERGAERVALVALDPLLAEAEDDGPVAVDPLVLLSAQAS